MQVCRRDQSPVLKQQENDNSRSLVGLSNHSITGQSVELNGPLLPDGGRPTPIEPGPSLADGSPRLDKASQV